MVLGHILINCDGDTSADMLMNPDTPQGGLTPSFNRNKVFEIPPMQHVPSTNLDKKDSQLLQTSRA